MAFACTAAQYLNHKFQEVVDALRNAMHYISYHNPRYVLIVSSDQVYSMDFNLLLIHHVNHNAEVTIAAHHPAKDLVNDNSRILINDEYKVIDYVEKYEDVNSLQNRSVQMQSENTILSRYLIPMGVYFFNINVLQDILDNSQETSFIQNILSHAKIHHDTYCYPFRGYWKDVGTIRNFFDANMEWLNGGIFAKTFHGDNTIITHSRLLPPSIINGARIENAIISEGCTIGAVEIRRSIIGLRSRIDDKTIIEDTIVTGNTGFNGNTNLRICANCHIKNAIIDKNVSIGEGSSITGNKDKEDVQTELFTRKAGIVIIPANAVIPAGTIID